MPFDPDKYFGPLPKSAPASSGSAAMPFVTKGITYKGLQLASPDSAGEMSGATSAASTAASEAAKYNSEKEQLQNFIGQFIDPNRPLTSISAEEMLKAKNATPEIVEKVRAILGLEQSDKAISGESAKVKELASSGLRQVKALGDEILKGNKLIGAALPFGIGDRKTDFIQNDLSDLIGRLRSGGAINKEEAPNFEALIPGWMDFTQEEKLYKLNELGNKFLGISQSMKTGDSFTPIKPQTSYEEMDSDALKQLLIQKLQSKGK